MEMAHLGDSDSDSDSAEDEARSAVCKRNGNS